MRDYQPILQEGTMVGTPNILGCALCSNMIIYGWTQEEHDDAMKHFVMAKTGKKKRFIDWLIRPNKKELVCMECKNKLFLK